MTGDVVLRARGLRRTYGSGATAVAALRGVDLDLRAGELVILRGASGSGKTTLLNLLGGLDAPDAGEVTLGDDPITGASEADLARLRRRDLGFVFQGFALLPVLSALENVELPMRIAGVPAADRAERTRALLEAVGLTGHENQRPDELSGGQQQRLGIARALATEPRVLIADEPTGQLDSVTADAMMGLLAGLVRDRGVAAIVSTHDSRMAEFGDRIVEIRAGQLTA